MDAIWWIAIFRQTKKLGLCRDCDQALFFKTQVDGSAAMDDLMLMSDNDWDSWWGHLWRFVACQKQCCWCRIMCQRAVLHCRVQIHIRTGLGCVDGENCRVELEVYQVTGSTYLLDGDRATRFIYLRVIINLCFFYFYKLDLASHPMANKLLDNHHLLSIPTLSLNVTQPGLKLRTPWPYPMLT